MHERRPAVRDFTVVEFARAIHFTLNQAARGLLSGEKLRRARKIAFLLTGSPEIGPDWGPPLISPYKVIELGRPTQLAPIEPVVMKPDTRLWMDDHGKAPAAQP